MQVFFSQTAVYNKFQFYTQTKAFSSLFDYGLPLTKSLQLIDTAQTKFLLLLILIFDENN